MTKKILSFLIIIMSVIMIGCKEDDPVNPPPSQEENTPDKPDQPDEPNEPDEPENPEPLPTPEGGYRIYAYNNTGWSNLYVYMWGQVNHLNGEWPGMSPTGTTIFNGYEFFYYEMGEENTGLSENVIFNNKTVQLNEFSYNITEDIYVEVTSAYVAKINPDNFTPSAPVTNDGTAVTDMVIYEANPRFFGNNNCLNALAGNLQRIADLGCNVLWIMPICEPSTSSQSIGSPYSIKNYEVMNSRYGTMADLQQLVNSAHNLGIKVVLDWVPNHTGWDNPWVTEHPDWFLQENGKIVSPPGQGWNDVAQLNYNNPEVGEAMSDVIKYWVNEANLDGIRFDYADSPYITPDFWRTIATELRTIKSDFILLAESSNYVFYNYGFDMIYDWNSAPTISNGFLKSAASEIVKEAENAVSKVPEGDSILRYVFNHDVLAEKGIDTYFGSIEALPAAYVCASMLNGTPMIYSGMDATGLTGKHNILKYDQLTFSSTLTPVYNAINEAFKTTTELRSGTLTNYSSNKIVCFTRTTTTNTLLVAVNVTSGNESISTPAAVQGTTMTDLLNGGTLEMEESISLGAYEYMILIK